MHHAPSYFASLVFVSLCACGGGDSESPEGSDESGSSGGGTSVMASSSGGASSGGESAGPSVGGSDNPPASAGGSDAVVTTGGTNAGGSGGGDAVVTTGGANAGGSGGSSSGASNPGAAGCDRAGLEAAVDSYLAALAAGDPSLMPLSSSAAYVVNERSATLAQGEGLFAGSIPVDFHRNLLDVNECASFTEVISASGSHPYVLGVRLQVSDAGEVSEVTVVETDDGDWLFDADNYLKYSPDEDWSALAEGERLSYQELIDAGDAYFAYWDDKNTEVPWGTPCARLEGGAYTGDSANSSCDVGIPDDTPIRVQDHLVDVDHGMVVLFLNLGGADTHLFRVPTTGIRYIHTLTVQ